MFREAVNRRKIAFALASTILLTVCLIHTPLPAAGRRNDGTFTTSGTDLKDYTELSDCWHRIQEQRGYGYYKEYATTPWYEQWSQTYGGGGHSEFAQPIGDIDGDGVNEIIVGGYEDIGRAHILSYNKNTGTYIEEYGWTYSAPPSYYTVPSGACVVDLDGDGRLEFVLSWTYSGPIGIYAYRWNGSTLTTLDVYSAAGAEYPYDVYACDYDNDGREEVLVANAPNANGGGYHVTALGWNSTRNEFAAEAFWKLTGYDTTMECPMIWSGDTDKDGKTEAIACISDGDGATAGTWALNWNTETGQWQEALVYNGLIAGGTHYAVAVGDVDRDGTPEIGIGNNVPQYGAGACLFEWDGSAYKKVWEGSWATEYPTIEAIAIGDADNDGKKEFCVGGGHVHIIVWTGSTYAEEATIADTSGVLSGLNIGDCDSDGWNELKACDIMGVGPGKEWIFKHDPTPPDEVLIEKVVDPPTLVHDLVAFRYPDTLSPRDEISPAVPASMKVPFNQTWFYWVCDFPYAMFAHPTRYAFVDHETGQVDVELGDWWPELNGVELWGTPEEFWDTDYWVYTTQLHPRINVMFEEAHMPVYTIGTNPAFETEGGYSEFASYLTSHGYSVSTIDYGKTIDSTLLGPADVLVIVAPMENYSAHEIDAIENWVKSGGNLLLISEWDDPLGIQASVIASRFGISFAGDVIHDTDEYVGNETFYPYFSGMNLQPHQITHGVTRVEMYAGDGIKSAPANEIRLIVTDMDGTATWHDGTPASGVSIMSAFDGGTAGSGRLVVITDTNFWDSAGEEDGDGIVDFYDSDNEVLALNVINWLASTHTNVSTSFTCENRVDDALTSQALTASVLPQYVKRALIVLGSGGGSEDMKTSVENWRELLMIRFNYSDDEITYVSPEKYATFVDYTTSEENIGKAIQELSGALKSGGSLSVLIVAHGGKEDGTDPNCTHGYIYLSPRHWFWDNNLTALLSGVDVSVNITVVVQSCFGGVFADDLCKVPQVKVAITSSDWNSISFFDVDAEWSGLKIKDVIEPNPEDWGCEFLSGLIEDLGSLSSTYGSDFTSGRLFVEGFRNAVGKDASYLNRKALQELAITVKLWGEMRGSQCYPDPLIKIQLFKGDINLDGTVSIVDVVIAATAYESYVGHERWNLAADVNCDGIVNIVDIVVIASYFGTVYY